MTVELWIDQVFETAHEREAQGFLARLLYYGLSFFV